MIATHAPSFVGHQIPNGQDVEGALLLDANHALCHVPSLFRLDEVEQGMFGAICVPEREDGVVGEAVGLMYLHVASTVFAIDIHIDGGIDHCVIERGVEECLLVVRAFYLESSQFLSPLLSSFCPDLLKGESGRFCLEVGKSTALADGRKRDFDGKLTACRELQLKVGGNLAACHVGEVVVDVVLAPKAVVLHSLVVVVAVCLNRFGERNGEVGVVLSCPAVGDAVAGQKRIVFYAQIAPKRLPFVVVYAVSKVEDELSFA